MSAVGYEARRVRYEGGCLSTIVNPLLVANRVSFLCYGYSLKLVTLDGILSAVCGSFHPLVFETYSRY